MSDATFKLRITFTGIFTIVPNYTLEEADRLCFLLVDARRASVEPYPRRKTIDADAGAIGRAQYLERHEGFMILDPRNLNGSHFLPGQKAQVVWSLHPQRINFKCSQTEETGLSFVRDLREEFAVLSKFAPGFGAVDPMTLNRDLPRGDVLAQIVVDRGKIIPNNIQPWKFVPLDSNTPEEVKLAHEIIVEIPNLTSVQIWSTPFGGGPGVPIDLSPWPDADSDVNISVSNLCEINPLGWPKAVQPENQGNEGDLDFKWHFELLAAAKQQELKERLGTTGELPYPRSEGLPSAVGENCYGALADDVDFDLDL